MMKMFKKAFLIPAFFAAMYASSFAKPVGNKHYDTKKTKENQEVIFDKNNYLSLETTLEKEIKRLGLEQNHNPYVNRLINGYKTYQTKTNKKKEKTYNELWNNLFALQVLDFLTTAEAKNKGYGELNSLFKDRNGGIDLKKIVYGKSIILGISYAITKGTYKDYPKEVSNALTFLNTFYEYVVKNNIRLNTHKSKQTVVYFGKITF